MAKTPFPSLTSSLLSPLPHCPSATWRSWLQKPTRHILNRLLFGHSACNPPSHSLVLSSLHHPFKSLFTVIFPTRPSLTTDLEIANQNPQPHLQHLPSHSLICLSRFFLFFFERASLIFIDQMVVNNNKILYRGLNAQSLINPEPNSQQSPIF